MRLSVHGFALLWQVVQDKLLDLRAKLGMAPQAADRVGDHRGGLSQFQRRALDEVAECEAKRGGAVEHQPYTDEAAGIIGVAIEDGGPAIEALLHKRRHGLFPSRDQLGRYESHRRIMTPAPAKPTLKLSIGEVEALRVRCSETLLPYVESDKPVAVDLNVSGDFTIIIPQRKAA